MFPALLTFRKHCYETMFPGLSIPSENMARKQCFLVSLPLGNMARKECFLVCLHLQDIWLGNNVSRLSIFEDNISSTLSRAL